jgi:YebC/PmpR family DNA-binding regulatory protein
MSGHSKWATIKRKKAALDVKRGKAFSQLSKEISVAARLGGGDPAGNSRLRLLIEKAREINMPNDNVVRAIKKGTGELPGAQYEASTYEGYGPHGIAVMVDVLTDNKNRTVADLRKIFSSKGGNLAESGAVSWMFSKLGVVQAAGKATEEQIIEQLIEFDIKDVDIADSIVTITCETKSLEDVKTALAKLGLKIEHADVEWVSQNDLDLHGQPAQAVTEFLNELEEHDDVQHVYTNFAS